MRYRLALQRCRDWVLDLKAHWRENGVDSFDGFMVNVTHMDGTSYSFRSAKAVTHRVPHSDHTFLVVFTEHHRDHIFVLDELEDYSQWAHCDLGIPQLNESFQEEE